MKYLADCIGILTLVSSVNLLPLIEDGVNSRSRQERSSSPIGVWGNSSISKRESHQLAFPDQAPSVDFVPKFGKTSPSCAKGSTFCDSVDNYPSKYIENLLQTSGKQFREMLSNDIVIDAPISTKFDGVNVENSLCTSMESVVYPKMAQNKEDQWLFVVNHGEYKQGIRIEKCHSSGGNGGEGSMCKFHEMFPQGYKATCKQKHVYRKLIALNGEGKTITDTFQLPSCCACLYSHDSSFQSSVGKKRK